MAAAEALTEEQVAEFREAFCLIDKDSDGNNSHHQLLLFFFFKNNSVIQEFSFNFKRLRGMKLTNVI